MRPARIAAAGVVLLLSGAIYVLGGSPARPTISTVEAGDSGLARGLEPGPAASVETAPGPTRTTRAPTHTATDPSTFVEEGMAAWGRFAVTGNLEEVAPWFAEDGPQWARFVFEARQLVAEPIGPPPYTVAVASGPPVGDGEERTVHARVRFVRTGEPTQSFDWVVVLRRRGRQWRIWTVTEAQAGPSASMSTP